MRKLNLAGLDTKNVKIGYNVNKFIVLIDNIFCGSFYDSVTLNTFLDLYELSHVSFDNMARIQYLTK